MFLRSKSKHGKSRARSLPFLIGNLRIPWQVIVHRREPLMPKKYLLSVIISILTILLLPVSVLPISADYSAETNASTRYVAVTGFDIGSCTDPSAPCRNIQYAINQSVSGDTIKVAVGTYTYAAASDICPSEQTKSVVCTNQKALTLLGGYTMRTGHTPTRRLT